MKINSRLALLILLISSCGTAFAGRDVPVVDLSKSAVQGSSAGLEVDQNDAGPARATGTHQNEPMDQRVLRLERQISNLTEMNYSGKMERLQQEIQQLQGQIEVQTHELSQLKDQVRSFYQDLDTRIVKLGPEGAAEKNQAIDRNKSSLTKEASAQEVSSSKGKELQSYETAFNFLNKKDYEKATTGFQAFIKDYPNSAYAVNAHYWLGEIYYLKDKSDLANKEFQLIINNYPDSPKVADALLKVALIAMDAGNYSKAKVNLMKVQKQFPGSTAAKIASLRLKEIKQKS